MVILGLKKNLGSHREVSWQNHIARKFKKVREPSEFL